MTTLLECFLPREKDEKEYCFDIITKYFKKFGLEIIVKRNVPTNKSILGKSIIGKEPSIIQYFVKETKPSQKINQFESKLFLARRNMEIELKSFDFYVVSLSPRVITYKGMIMSNNLRDFYLDFQDELFISSLAIVHQRFSTNTFPSWELAQPFRFFVIMED